MSCTPPQPATGGAAWLLAYRVATCLAAPVVRAHVRRRALAGKEDATRLAERFGRSTRPRPPGVVVWFHAASVGELLSLAPLLERLAAAAGPFSALVTTGTVTSASLAAERLPVGAIHQYVPLDLALAVRRFLDHWRPDVAVRVESEIWPNQLEALRARGVPSLLVNARLSPASGARWCRMPGLGRRLMSGFDAVLAQSPADAERISGLRGRKVAYLGNLKAAASPLPFDEASLRALRDVVGGRPSWILASSHEGEEAAAARAHVALESAHPGLLTIVAPRHPDRGPAVVDLMERAGLRVALRSASAVPGPHIAVYVVDTLGELGLWYRLADIAVVGGSLLPCGGHNPLEPAALRRPILFGPHMENFGGLAEGLVAVGGAHRTDAGSLAQGLDRLLPDAGARQSMAGSAAEFAAAQARAADRIVSELLPWFPAR